METVLARWQETYERSIELADVTFTILNELVDYCKTNNISFFNEKGSWNLVSKAQSIFKEIEEVNSSKFAKLLADEKKHLFRTDDE
jgi:hypothetical protein